MLSFSDLKMFVWLLCIVLALLGIGCGYGMVMPFIFAFICKEVWERMICRIVTAKPTEAWSTITKPLEESSPSSSSSSPHYGSPMMLDMTGYGVASILDQAITVKSPQFTPNHNKLKLTELKNITLWQNYNSDEQAT